MNDDVALTDNPISLTSSIVISGDKVILTDDGMTVTLTPYSESMARTPDFSGRWQYSGFTYADQPIGITDGAIVINGTPWEGNK